MNAELDYAQEQRIRAAAPDLLAVVQDFLNVGMSVRADSVIWKEARAAIAQAIGE